MLNSTENSFATEEEQRNEIFDILYQDRARINLLLAQFLGTGHLSQVITQASDKQTSAKVSSGSYTVKGSSDALVVKGEINATKASNSSYSSEDSSNRTETYDVLWSNTFLFLDFLYESGVSKSEISDASVGDIVSISGSISVCDLALLNDFLAEIAFSSHIESQLSANIRRELSQQQRRKSSRDRRVARTNGGVALSIMKSLPKPISVEIETAQDKLWGTLDEDGLITSIESISLKHGAFVQGQWRVVGILDARPDDFFQAEPNIVSVQTNEQGSGQTLAQTLSRVTRQVMGRPGGQYGITPLIIYRTISPTPQSP